MNYDPNSDQELERSPQPAEDIPAAQEDVQLTPPASLPDEQAQPVPVEDSLPEEPEEPVLGAFANSEEPELDEPPVAYHGRFAAKAPMQENAEEYQQDNTQPEYIDVQEPEEAPEPPVYDGGDVPPVLPPHDYSAQEPQEEPTPLPQRSRTRAVKKGRPRRK